MRTVRMTVQYDGTEFAGFQIQANQRTVQQVLEAAAYQVTGERIRVVGAGRTDAGVHATGQVVSFSTASTLDPTVLRRAFNAVLPADVVVVEAADAPPGFHARFSARSREYRYTIWNAPERLAIGRQFAYHWRAPLDVEAMDQAARVLIGRHDFAAFAAATAPSDQTVSTVRTIFRLHCWRDGRRVFVQVAADAFLPRMVRNLVGTLLPVGIHRAQADDVARILASRDRRQAGVTVPAHGLCLTRVQYD